MPESLETEARLKEKDESSEEEGQIVDDDEEEPSQERYDEL